MPQACCGIYFCSTVYNCTVPFKNHLACQGLNYIHVLDVSPSGPLLSVTPVLLSYIFPFLIVQRVGNKQGWSWQSQHIFESVCQIPFLHINCAVALFHSHNVTPCDCWCAKSRCSDAPQTDTVTPNMLKLPQTDDPTLPQTNAPTLSTLQDQHTHRPTLPWYKLTLWHSDTLTRWCSYMQMLQHSQGPMLQHSRSMFQCWLSQTDALMLLQSMLCDWCSDTVTPRSTLGSSATNNLTLPTLTLCNRCSDILTDWHSDTSTDQYSTLPQTDTQKLSLAKHFFPHTDTLQLMLQHSTLALTE
jgi:hypothetical protein